MFMRNVEKGDGYIFTAIPAERLKHHLQNSDNSIVGKVPMTLEIGNLGIEINIRADEKDEMYLEYFCCRKVDGEWESYMEISEPVNLDVPDIRLEMMRVLEEFAQRQGLNFTDKGKQIFILSHCDEWKSRDSMRIVTASTDYRELCNVVASEILSGDMGYKGEFYADGLSRFRDDYIKGCDDLSLLDYGFYEVYNETDNTRCLSAVLLNANDKEFEQYISHYRVQAQSEVSDFVESDEYEPDDGLEQ